MSKKVRRAENDILSDLGGSESPRPDSDDVFSSAASPTTKRRGIRRFENKSSPRLKILSGAFVAILVVGVLCLLVVASYLNLNLPFVPRGLVRAADITITSVPFLPKTPRQVLTRAFFETGRVKSGEHNFNLELVESSGQKDQNAILSPSISGTFKKSRDQIDLSANIFPGFPSEDQNAKSEINFIEQEDFLYFRVKNFPNFQGLDFSNLGEGWHKIDMTTVVSDAKADVKTDSEIESTIKEKINLLLDLFASDALFKKISTLPNEQVNDIDSRRYKIDLNEEDTKKIINIFATDASSLLKDVSIELWVGNSNYLLNKIEISGQLSKDPTSPSPNVILSTPDLAFKLVYELQKANENVEMGVPDSAKEVDSLLELYLLIQPKEAGRDPASQILGAASGLGEFGANFITIERLLHVLYLTPQSF